MGNIIDFLYNSKWLSKLRIYIGKKIREKGMCILYYKDEERKKIVNIVNKLHKKYDLRGFLCEFYNLYMLTKNTDKLKGDIAEVGVYEGGSARVIC